MGMTGFRQRDQGSGIVSVRDGNGSRYPTLQSIAAKTAFMRTVETIANSVKLPTLQLQYA